MQAQDAAAGQGTQFVVVPMSQNAERSTNALGAFGFFVAVVGLFVPTGLIAFLGLLLSLSAIGHAPRGWAAGGVVVGLIGTAVWAVIMISAVMAGLLVAVVAAVVAVVGFTLLQPEVIEITSDMVNVALVTSEYADEHDAIPSDIDDLALGDAVKIDPWGGEYRLVAATGEPGFDIVSAGPDKRFDTDDDARLQMLDRVWENAFESLETRLDAFAGRLEELPVRYDVPSSGRHADYERAARRAIAIDAH